MAFFYLNEKRLFIDNRLKERLDKKIVPDLKKRDMDALFIVDGKERIGKSVFTFTPAAYISSVFGTPFNISNICNDPLEFKNKVISAKKNEVIIYDEAYGGMGSSGALTHVNRLLKNLMMEMGQKNLLVFVVLPTFFLLEKYVALFRARGLFHIYTNKGKRGFWVYYNSRNKKYLYLKGKKEFNYNCMKYPRLRGVFTNQYPIDEEEYRAKKAKGFIENKRSRKEEIYREMLRRTIALIHDEYGLSVRNIEKLLSKYSVKRGRQSILEDIQEYTKENTKDIKANNKDNSQKKPHISVQAPTGIVYY